MQAALLFLLFSFLIILGILISMLYVVRQQCCTSTVSGYC